MLLDAAMGTGLRERGLPAEALPEEWILTRPDAIAAVHASHASAGARVLLTCTFNCTGPRLATRGIEEKLDALCGWAERLARAASRGALVAGCVGPTGLSVPGRAGPPDAELRERFRRPFRALADAGVDLLWTETHYALAEARAALAAARETGLAVAATMAFAERDGGLAAPDGEPAEECLRALASDGAAAVGANCLSPGPALAALSARLAPDLRVPFVAKPNAGPPGAALGPDAFAAAVAPAARAGARLLGGCCGTGAAHLAALGALLRGL
jgi:5-methyltetrahydrofolate--homocysteine methyltransferase